jgi:putative SOS response-associated peptidase YedK
MSARFGSKNAKAILGIMVRDALNEAGKSFLRLILGRVFHSGRFTSCTHAILLGDWAAPSTQSSVLSNVASTHHIAIMCGRVIQSSGPVRYAIVDGMNVRDSRVHNYPPRWNAAPSQDLLVIRRNHQTGEVSLEPLRWGLIPYWCQDPKGGRRPINAKCETVRNLPTFRDAYRRRRCILPVDGFFEWKAIKGQKAKQPYTIAMKDGRPFGIGGRWENWKEPASGEWIRTFAVITTDANELVAEIHDRMPLILAPGDYARWLSDEPDPHELVRPFLAGSMRMWPISTRVNKPENDDPSIVEPIELATSAA